jgi:hypothetical protein
MIATGSRRPGLTKLEDNRGNASFPILKDMQEWWKEWGPKIVSEVGRQGWVLFLLDAHEKVTEVEMLLSRVLRNKSKWDSAGFSEAEWSNPEQQATAALRWFERHAPGVQKDAPEWAQFLIAAQYNAFSVLSRLGREVRGAVENGYSPVVLEQSATGDGLTVTHGGDRFLREVA